MFKRIVVPSWEEEKDKIDFGTYMDLCACADAHNAKMARKERRFNRISLAVALFFSVIGLITVLFIGFGSTAQADTMSLNDISVSDCYSTLFRVSNTEYLDNGDTIVTFDCTATQTIGVSYKYYYMGQDIEVGEFYSAIMYKNGTDYINNDFILDISYERPDLLDGGY